MSTALSTLKSTSIFPTGKLTPSYCRHIGGNFIRHTGQERVEISDADLDDLSRVKMNGLEIKSLKGGRKIDMSRISILVENRAVTIAAFGAN